MFRYFTGILSCSGLSGCERKIERVVLFSVGMRLLKSFSNFPAISWGRKKFTKKCCGKEKIKWLKRLYVFQLEGKEGRGLIGQYFPGISHP